ncbi:MAG: PQQ-binding-like beta-propeller repeat protein [Myxococcota bacterium]|nr:PQQ-binding-like beta-propeller repeat protein [Myxococcota bacterium]
MLLKRASLGLLLAVFAVVLVACQSEAETESASDTLTDPTDSAVQYPCTPTQNAPYDLDTPYLGIHGDPGNSDVIPCDSAPSFEEAWHVLKGHAIPQPNTFSPDASTTYVTAFPTEAEPCTLYALNAETGETQWCKELHLSVAGSSVEVDEDGILYVAVESAIVSYTAAGEERWKTVLDGADGSSRDHWTNGVHFTQTGHVATVTIVGKVLLLDRATGEVAAEMDLPTEYGFVSPEPSVTNGLDLVSFFPESSVADLETAFGSRESANTTLGNFLGLSGNFTDNTIGISNRDELYIQGGGPTVEDGSIIQLKVVEGEGGMTLEKGWYVLAAGGSAASPSISRNGKYMVLSDGAASGSALSTSPTPAHVALVDLEACNANTDGAPEREICAVVRQIELERGSASGAPPIADDGTVYYWESGLDFASYYDNADLFSFGPEQEKRAVTLPDGKDWTSVMTVTNNHLIGTISKYTESDQMLVTRVLPATIEHSLALMDRATMELLWETPVTDDSTSTVTIDRDGALYVTLFGLLNIIATEERPTLGLVKFVPAP